MRLAVDSGIESRQCELIADLVMTLSSIPVRSRILARLRQARYHFHYGSQSDVA